MSAAFMPRQPELDDDVVEATVVSVSRSPASGRTARMQLEQLPNKLQSSERQPSELQSSEQQRSMLERFIDSFFRRENIRWLAVIGAAIVVASSLMLVTREWANWPVMAKFLTILGYTGLTYLFSEWGRKHLGLQITARVLQFLTLLLLPICFLSLSWLFGPTSELAGAAGLQMAVLIVPAIGLAWFASSRIFEYLWRGQQNTFLVSYLLLCASGALPRMTDAWSAAGLTFALWFITTVGSIKINRHVFWMTEEHRLPRAFGFLPIALLGIQFLALVAIKTALALPIEWMGLVLVLMSATVLMTTRAVADVHRQRTGGNLRPLPWNILVPLILGLVMALFGVAVSFHGFSYGQQTTYAIVPSTLLASLLMLQATRETNQRSFVWIGLVLLTIAYQCTPTLFAGLVQQVKASAASAVGEDRLPIAFYGLSYLPLLLTISISSAYLARRREFAFAVPMRHFVTGLSLALFALSWMHLKAVFPVAALSFWLFSFYSILFQDRRYILVAILGLTVAVGAWIPFANAMQMASIDYFHIVTSLSVLALALASFPMIDRWINRIPQPSETWRQDLANVFGEPTECARRWSIVLAIASSACWVMWVMRSVLLTISDATFGQAAALTLFDALHAVGYLPALVLIASFAVHTIRSRSAYSSLAMWSMVTVSSLALAYFVGTSLQSIVSGAVVGFALIQLLTMIPLRSFVGANLLRAYLAAFSSSSATNGGLPLRVAFLLPLQAICSGSLVAITSVAIVPSVIAAHVGMCSLAMSVAMIAVLVWLIALKVGFRNRVAGVIAAIAFPLVCSATLITFEAFPIELSTLPLIWTVSAVAIAFVAYRSEPRELISIQRVSIAWVLACAVLSLSSFDLIARLTALVALCSLAVTERHRLKRAGWSTLAIAANVQVIMLVAGLSGLTSWLVIPIRPAVALATLPNIVAALAVSAAVWDLRRLRFDEELRIAFASTLRVCFVLTTCLTLTISHLDPTQLVVCVAAFGIAASVEFIEGVRKQHVGHVWSTFAVVVSALGWLIVHKQLVIGSGVSQVALIGVSVISLLSARVIRNHDRLGFAMPPLEQLGLTCPLAVVALTLFRTAAGIPALLPGIDSMVMLAAAAIYFYRGLATSNRLFLIAAAVIFNIASAQLWLSLNLNDLQLYLVPLGLTVLALVELLKKEIPVASHNTIRNIGSLAILVSPTFEILSGSWLHMVTLMLLSVLVILLAIGLRIRNLVYIGTAFLLADLVAMVIQSAIANPGMLWIGGLATGVAVIALAAYCENHREQLLSRIRLLNAELATWN